MIEVTLPWSVLPSSSDWDNRLGGTIEIGIWMEETVPNEYKWQISADNRLTILLPNEEVAIMFKLAFAHIWT